MNRKKTLFFVSALCCLSLSICGTNNKVYADMPQDEKTKLKNIESQRHCTESKQMVLDLLRKNIQDKNISEEFRIYCFSTAIKLMGEDELLNLFETHNISSRMTYLNNGEHSKEYVSQCFNLFYRALSRIKILSNKNDKLEPNLQKIIDGGINFLNSDQFNLEVFREYDELSKLRILQSVISMANSKCTYQYGQIIINKLSEIEIDNLCKGSENDNTRKKILLDFAKIPSNNKDSQLKALKALLGIEDWNTATYNDLRDRAQNDLNKEALLTFAKIPDNSQKDNRLKTLGALLDIEDWNKANFKELAEKSDFNREALLTFAKIPSNTDNQINALYALYETKDNRYKNQIQTTAKNIKGYMNRETICVKNYKYLETLCTLNQNNNNYEEMEKTYQQNVDKIRNNYHRQESPRWQLRTNSHVIQYPNKNNDDKMGNNYHRQNLIWHLSDSPEIK